MQRQQRKLRTKRHRPLNTHTQRSNKEIFKAVYGMIRDHSRIHQSLIALTLFVLFNNNITAHAAQNSASLDQTSQTDPYQIADTYRLLKEYIPGASTDPDNLALLLQKKSVQTEAPETSPFTQANLFSPSPQTPELSPTDSPTVSDNPDTHYTVQIGDTLSGIAAHYNLKIASIKVKNNLSDVDSLKPGEDLLIPVQDLSDKSLKAAEDRERAHQTRDTINQKNKSATISSPHHGFGLLVPIHSKGISRGIQPGHDGIDYRADIGTPIAAAADGVIVIASSSGWNGGFGKTILIAHGNGLTTRYGHLSEVDVKPGQIVKQGAIIALSGDTGNSTGPHLHFETRLNERVVYPY